MQRSVDSHEAVLCVCAVPPNLLSDICIQPRVQFADQTLLQKERNVSFAQSSGRTTQRTGSKALAVEDKGIHTDAAQKGQLLTRSSPTNAHTL